MEVTVTPFHTFFQLNNVAHVMTRNIANATKTVNFYKIS